MDQKTLSELRVLQFKTINIAMLVTFIIFLIIVQIGLLLRMLLIGMSVLVFVQLAFFLRKGHYFIFPFPFPKRLQLLQAYEGEKINRAFH